LLFLPAAVLAEGPEKCVECHSIESEAWQDSPHSQAGVVCEACHGEYVADHPKEGAMQLDVGSAVCNDCHAETHAEWEQSPHAEAGIQCIGCHLSHSQDFRLTDETLCSACHREERTDFAHVTHTSAHISCTDCHLSKVGSGDGAGEGMAPSHNFTFAVHTCIECHEDPATQQIVEGAGSYENQRALEELQTADECIEDLSNQLEVAEESNQSLKTLSVTGLGMGVGIGGMLGVVAILAIGYITQARKAKDE